MNKAAPSRLFMIFFPPFFLAAVDVVTNTLLHIYQKNLYIIIERGFFVTCVLSALLALDIAFYRLWASFGRFLESIKELSPTTTTEKKAELVQVKTQQFNNTNNNTNQISTTQEENGNPLAQQQQQQQQQQVITVADRSDPESISNVSSTTNVIAIPLQTDQKNQPKSPSTSSSSSSSSPLRIVVVPAKSSALYEDTSSLPVSAPLTSPTHLNAPKRNTFMKEAPSTTTTTTTRTTTTTTTSSDSSSSSSSSKETVKTTAELLKVTVRRLLIVVVAGNILFLLVVAITILDSTETDLEAEPFPPRSSYNVSSAISNYAAWIGISITRWFVLFVVVVAVVVIFFFVLFFLFFLFLFVFFFFFLYRFSILTPFPFFPGMLGFPSLKH
jgi:hypothetical protein